MVFLKVEVGLVEAGDFLVKLRVDLLLGLDIFGEVDDGESGRADGKNDKEGDGDEGEG